MAISRRLLTLAVVERAKGVTNAAGYLGLVDGLSRIDPAMPADPPTKSGTDLRVTPYFVLFPGAGVPDTEDGTEVSVAGHTDTFVDLDWQIQITAAAGDQQDLLALVDRIHDRFWRWTPTDLTGGIIAGPLEVPNGWNPGVLVDRQFTPHRLYVPLLFQLTAHT